MNLSEQKELMIKGGNVKFAEPNMVMESGAQKLKD